MLVSCVHTFSMMFHFVFTEAFQPMCSVNIDVTYHKETLMLTSVKCIKIKLTGILKSSYVFDIFCWYAPIATVSV